MRHNVRYLFLVAGLLLVSIAYGADTDRPQLMSERFYLAHNEETPKDSRVWNKVLLDLDIPGFLPRENNSYSECHFDTALADLRKLRENAATRSYLKIWASNQDKVVATCDGSPKKNDPPTLQQGPSLPSRARSDFLYQLGSWHFYRGDYQAALKAYEQVENIRTAPMRPKAAYMVIRSLAYLDQGDEAYNKILKVLADQSLKDVHSIASNYRFVMMSNTRDSDVPHVSQELAKRHLKWLLNVIKAEPEKAANPVQARADYNDAISQLNVYFPLYDRMSKQVDWWLNDGEETFPRMQAVKYLAPDIELIDWMQAQWAYNAFNDDWLWSLHAEQNSYWQQNQHIVEHEMTRLKKSGNAAWLQLAISRVHPSEPIASVLLKKAEAYLKRDWKSETIEYREWLFDLWTHSIRISMAQGKIEQAFALIVGHQDMSQLFGNLSYDYRFTSHHASDYAEVLEKTLRWLVYTGQVENARMFLNAIQKNSPRSFTQWRTLLATNVDETLASGFKPFWTESPGTSKALWQEMLNTAPSRFLEHLAEDDRFSQGDRALISRSLLTRAILLNAVPADVDHAAAIAAKHNPELREDILAAVAGHEKLKYVELLLKNPRFRPAVFLEYAPVADSRKAEEPLGSIDTYNHNDNNWWCRFDKDMFAKRVFNAAKITPTRSPILSEPEVSSEFDSFLEKQQALLRAHPYQELVDKHEIETLEAIPSAPEFLSTYINQWEQEAPAARTEEERNRRAANLHRAVRTTRYGCNNNGTHATYSRESFKLLHTRYNDTPWAKATPYWFK
jgi:hypothetical protein